MFFSLIKQKYKKKIIMIRTSLNLLKTGSRRSNLCINTMTRQNARISVYSFNQGRQFSVNNKQPPHSSRFGLYAFMAAATVGALGAYAYSQQ